MNEAQVALVHRAILDDAARIANQAVLNDPELTGRTPQSEKGYKPGRFAPGSKRRTGAFIAGAFFRADQFRTKRGGLTLSLDESVAELPVETITRLHEIGRRAVLEALVINRQKIAWLIIEDAKAGQNYFDRFKDANEQLQIL